MEIARSDEDVAEFMEIINRVRQENPGLVDKYMEGGSRVDAISGHRDLIPA